MIPAEVKKSEATQSRRLTILLIAGVACMIAGLLIPPMQAGETVRLVRWMHDAGKLRYDAILVGWLDCEGRHEESRKLAAEWVKRCGDAYAKTPAPMSNRPEFLFLIDAMETIADGSTGEGESPSDIAKDVSSAIDVILDQCLLTIEHRRMGPPVIFGMSMGWVGVILLVSYALIEGNQCRR